MVPKRPLQELGGEEYGFPVPEWKRRPLLNNVVRDVMRDGPLNEKAWENFFRPVVRDELEKVLVPYLKTFASFPRPLPQIGSTSAASGLQLHFVNSLPPTIFTGSRVESEDCTPLQIVLRDASTHNVVRSGPISSLKIEVLVLSSEFGSDDQEDWSEREFNDGLVREREGKRPLVIGEVTLNLTDGVCLIDNLAFTDNSSWIRSRKFRLAARVVPKSLTEEVRIREAISKPFQVKDHRGESYKKNYPPSLNDEIWRLEKIAKDGTFHRRLSNCGITSVRHLLQSYVKDPTSLRNIFGSVSNKIWNTIINHATTCYIDDHRLYAYHRAEHEISLLFNAIYKFVGAMIDNQFCSPDDLSPPQKVLVENLKKQAYQTYINVENMVLVDASDVLGIARPLPSLQAEPFNGPNPDMQQIGFQFTQQDEPSMQLCFNQASTSSTSTSTSYPYQAEGTNQFVVSLAPTSHPMPAFTPGLRNSFSAEDFGSVHFNGESCWPLSGSQGPIVPTAENLFSTWSAPMNTTWGGQGNSFCFGPSIDIDAGIPSFVHNSGTRKKPKACWCKLRAAIKWWVSVRTRRMSRPKYLGS